MSRGTLFSARTWRCTWSTAPPFFERGGRATSQECDAEVDYRQERAFSLAMDATRHQGNAIIYVHTRRQADDLAQLPHCLYTGMHGPPRIDALIFSYHAGRADHQTVEAAFASRRGVIVVATAALLDPAVVHWHVPFLLSSI